MYRIWNNKEKCWVKENIYVSPDMEIIYTEQYKRKENIVNKKLLPNNRFEIYLSCEVNDKNNKRIFEGDIVKTDFGVICVVAYVPEKLSYMLLDFKEAKYYVLNLERCGLIEVIGNVCENPDMIPEYTKK